jgi:siroheme synthase
MGAGQAGKIAVALMASGLPRDLPVLVSENATLPEARRVALTLEELPEIARYGLTGPTLIMLGRAFAAAVAESKREAPGKYAGARAAP